MAEIQDVTEALSRVLQTGGRARSDIESIRHATIDIEQIPALIEDPKRIVKEIGVPVQDHSQWSVSLVKRMDAVTRFRPIIVVIVHFGDCSGVIIIFY